MFRPFLFPVILVLVASCNPNRRVLEPISMAPAPDFSSDSAYAFIEQQVQFGPRVPGTEGHQQCGDFIVKTLSAYGAEVTEQTDSVTGYDGNRYFLRNIIATLNGANPRRIMLCAHWDSRPFADRSAADRMEPIVGANDNASGVAVLLEIARNLSVNAPQIGIDLMFFDLEDQGRPAFDTVSDPNDHGYCLGSEYWAEHLNGYQAEYGILLDMVGAENAIFTLEANSLQHAEEIMERVWSTGHQLGYDHHFRFNKTRGLFDDHTNVNEIANIPCIDIIQRDSRSHSGFGEYWHTHSDNLSIIDKNTLKAVGQTVTQVIYNEAGK